jgi:hypothetical protein
MTQTKASSRIETLKLIPHPEGGYYSETYRATATVSSEQGERSAGTHIYFLLAAGDISKWHKVDADEMWHLYEGGPLTLHLLSPDFSEYRMLTLDASTAPPQYHGLIPADWWQAAEPQGDYALMGCTVMPGFEFAGFAMLRDTPDLADKVRNAFPDVARLI